MTNNEITFIYLSVQKASILDAAVTVNIEKLESTIRIAKNPITSHDTLVFNNSIVRRLTPHVSLITNAQDYKGHSALHLAILNEHEDIVDKLLKEHCNVNTSLNERSNVEPFTRDGIDYTGIYEGNTPLMDASFHGNVSIVTKLIQHQAALEAVNKNNENAIIYAAKGGHKEVLDVLIAYDRRFSFNRENLLQTALGAAAMFGRLNVVEDVIRKWKHDPDYKDRFLSTPLIRAAEYNRPSVLKYLLQQGADSSIKDKNGKNAMDHANEKGNQEIIELLNNHTLTNSTARIKRKFSDD